jgi:hypothetical protein
MHMSVTVYEGIIDCAACVGGVVVDIDGGMGVLVLDRAARPVASDQSADAANDQHPAALHPKSFTVHDQGIRNVTAEDDEGPADDSAE